MSSVNVPLSWELQIKGAENVKSRLQQLNQEFKNNEITVSEYSKELRRVNQDARVLTQTSTIQKNVFLAMHPAVNQLSRAMSTLSSVARTALSITNALNLATLAFNSTSVSLVEIQAELTQKQRELAEAVVKYGKDSIEVSKIQEEINVLLAKQTEETKRIGDQQLQNLITLTAVGILVAKQALDISTKVLPAWAAFSALMGGMAGVGASVLAFFAGLASVFANPAMGQGLAFFVSQFLDFIPGMRELRQVFAEWLHSWAEVDGTFIDTAMAKFFAEDLPNAIAATQEWFGGLTESIITFFTESLPSALGDAALYLTNFFLSDFPGWVAASAGIISGMFANLWDAVKNMTFNAFEYVIDQVTSFVNKARSMLQKLIDFIVQGVRALGGRISGTSGSSTNQYSGMQGSAVTSSLHAATGFEGMINSPTLMTVGESGSEYVSVTPHGQSPSGGNVTIIVQGLITEHQLVGMFDNYLKSRLKMHGFGT